MSSSFEKREQAQEAKYAHDSEIAFKVSARRNKLLGLWAAELMGISGADAEAYGKKTVMADFEEPGDEDVFRTVMGDLTTAKVEMSDQDLRQKMDTLMAVAREQVEAEA
ncbi:MAG: DUF1476 domain-containing protein [Alphaproteobacteria bacterium]|jgi:hypothetical protein|nr:DUF1476 domain-containing protein [Alphaproteobacteria bacterium]